MARKPSAGKSKLDATCRVVVLHGPEAFLRAEYTSQLREALVGQHGEVDVLHFDGTTAQPADVLDECRSFGLMSAHKLVVVDQADQFVKEAHRPIVERYAEAPSEAATLVLRAERWHAGKLDKMVSEVGVIIKCEEIEEYQAVNWVMKRGEKRHAARIGRDAAELLVQRIGVDLVRLDSEVAKLAAGAGRDSAVTREMVVELVGQSREEEVWGIQQDLLMRDARRAISGVREALDVSRHPPVLVAWAMSDLARKLHRLSCGLRAGATAASLRSELKIWGASTGPMEQAAQRLSPEQASVLLRACVETDSKQKSGWGDPERLLERLALRFAQG
ncbi:MAG: DNA polymerase III subunit delta [Phycisphaeraceae bacterium]|nr:DNA polymerase III subunit delta [Phycisphaeraceae bacterium]MCW5754101.1 DNA polymerase III subunit delta [Phycisphaeraceae bacterium]